MLEYKTSDFLPERFEVLVRQFDSSTNCLHGSWWSCTSYMGGMSIWKYILPFWYFHNVFFEFVQMKDLCYWALQIQKSSMEIHCGLRPLSRYILKKKDFCDCVSTVLKNSKFDVQSKCDLFNNMTKLHPNLATYFCLWYNIPTNKPLILFITLGRISGHIFKGYYNGCYCTDDQSFLSDTQIVELNMTVKN